MSDMPRMLAAVKEEQKGSPGSNRVFEVGCDLERELAAAKEKLKALDMSDTPDTGIGSIYNACTFRDECRARKRELAAAKAERRCSDVAVLNAELAAAKASGAAYRNDYLFSQDRLKKAEAERDALRDPNHPDNYEGSTLQRLDALVHELTGDEGEDDSFTVLRRAWDALREDAERYRWILRQAAITDFIFKFLKSKERHVSNAIDAERAK